MTISYVAESDRSRMWLFISSLCLCLLVAAAWSLPVKILSHQESSYLTFAYIYDEPFYAARMQPLIPGTTRANPENGLGDPAFISQFYMEDMFRALLSITGIPVITLFWLSRFLMPILLIVSIFLIVREAFLFSGTKASVASQFILTALSGTVIFFEPFLFSHTPPVFGWLHRFPTNLEFIQSLIIAWLYLRAIREPSSKSIAWLVAAFCLLAYLRLYAAIPWGILSAGSLLVFVLRGRIRINALLWPALLFIGLMLPWALVAVNNSQLAVQPELMMRYFPSTPWRIHQYSNRYFIAAVFILICSIKANEIQRIILLSCAATTLSLSFVCTLFPFRSELLSFERYSSFYLTTCLLAFLLLTTRLSSANLKDALPIRFKIASACGALALTSSLIFLYSQVEVDGKYWSPYMRMKADLASIPAYQWVQQNTPADALILDDVASIEKLPDTVSQTINFFGTDNLFKVIAQRRTVFTGRLFVSSIPNRDLLALARLHSSVCGSEKLNNDEFMESLRTYRPHYILWRKSNPELNKATPLLKRISEPIYSDSERELWKLNLDRL